MEIGIKAIMLNLAIITVILVLGAWPLAKLWVVIHVISATIMTHIVMTSADFG